MPPETTSLTRLLEILPAGIAGYVSLALIVAYMVRRIYRDNDQSQDALLTRYTQRLDQMERALAAVSQDVDSKNAQIAGLIGQLADLRVQLAHAQASESRCRERMDAYETRIEELEHEIQQLRGEISEPIPT